MKPHGCARRRTSDFAMVLYVSFIKNNMGSYYFFKSLLVSWFILIIKELLIVHKLLITSDANSGVEAFEDWRYDVEEDGQLLFFHLF
jgi:hypothetical protein